MARSERTSAIARREPHTSWLARDARSVMRVLLALCLVPFSGVIGLCGLVQHYGCRLVERLRGHA